MFSTLYEAHNQSMTNEIHLPAAEGPDLFQALWSAPGSSRGFIGLRSDDTITLRGIEHGKLTVTGRTTVPGLGQVLTIHEAGSTYWRGRGMSRGYSGASMRTVAVQATDRDAFTFRYVELSNVSLGSNAAERDLVSTNLVRAWRQQIDPRSSARRNGGAV